MGQLAAPVQAASVLAGALEGGVLEDKVERWPGPEQNAATAVQKHTGSATMTTGVHLTRDMVSSRKLPKSVSSSAAAMGVSCKDTPLLSKVAMVEIEHVEDVSWEKLLAQDKNKGFCRSRRLRALTSVSTFRPASSWPRRARSSLRAVRRWLSTCWGHGDNRPRREERERLLERMAAVMRGSRAETIPKILIEDTTEDTPTHDHGWPAKSPAITTTIVQHWPPEEKQLFQIPLGTIQITDDWAN
ncbi:hypothetical protein B0I35DRAFT_273881 [Stachybotrys elegans]|uniref:Uncharacterized protein n=1 Tax=Stachybotrys elegans TaxID=80388 RepID=A0A8K0WQU7_9HYPO|nr:hypothetical protein B0I35DRAFT_273881 [Stachybotrys elegans]